MRCLISDEKRPIVLKNVNRGGVNGTFLLCVSLKTSIFADYKYEKYTENRFVLKKKRVNILNVVLLLIALFMGGQAYAQKNFAIRNNFIYDISGTPNLGFDVRISPHWTLGLNAGYRPWPTDDNTTRKWKHFLIAPELRHWTDSTFHRSYWGTNVFYSHYNVGHVTFPFGLYQTVRDHRVQGDLIGLGAFYGRSWRISRYIRLEGEVGLGVGYTWAKKYECAHCGSYLGRENKPFLIPKLTLNVVYQKAEKKPQEPIITPIDTTPPPPPVLAVHPVQENTGKAGALQRENPVLVNIAQYRPYDRTRILRKEKGALYVHFPVDKSDLRRDFRNNASTLDRIVDITRQIMADTTSSVCRIQIVGLASIEGRVPHNEQLAADRAQALKQYVQQQVPKATDDLFDVANGGEAWADLRDQINDVVNEMTKSAVEADGRRLAGLRQAIGIIDSEADLTRREQRLRQLDKGVVFDYIKKNFLSDQRNSGYLRIYFDYVPDTAAATINKATQLIQQEKYAEALSMLRGVQQDPRGWNALAVALWQTGDREAALNYFRLAAQQGNADARENLRKLMR